MHGAFSSQRSAFRSLRPPTWTQDVGCKPRRAAVACQCVVLDTASQPGRCVRPRLRFSVQNEAWPLTRGLSQKTKPLAAVSRTTAGYRRVSCVRCSSRLWFWSWFCRLAWLLPASTPGCFVFRMCPTRRSPSSTPATSGSSTSRAGLLAVFLRRQVKRPSRASRRTGRQSPSLATTTAIRMCTSCRQTAARPCASRTTPGTTVSSTGRPMATHCCSPAA